jgi:hypothetical protein
MAKKSMKKPKGRARKRVKTGNLPAKTLGADDVRAVKGGDGLYYSKVELEYKPQPSEPIVIRPIKTSAT